MKPLLAEVADRVIGLFSRAPLFALWIFRFILFNLELILKFTAYRHPEFRARLKEKKFVAQIRTKDKKIGRYFIFNGKGVISARGIHPEPDITITYHDALLGVRLMTPWRSQLDQINAMKTFKLSIEGPDELTSWFMETLSLMMSAGLEYGNDMGKGVKRYVNGTNGGPVFVYVKEGRIIRITPVEFDDRDAASWTIKARGKKFSPPTPSCHLVYCVTET